MRALMSAGPALERDNIAGYNPVIGTEEVVTKEYGNCPIANLENKQATILNINGEWVPAKFHCYGFQDIYEVTLRLNSNTIKKVQCTLNHRWVLENGKVVSTGELTAGDKIDFVSAKKPDEDEDYILGIRHGIIYGDGTASKSQKRVKGYHIRLCGQSAELLKFFDDYPVTYPPSAGGDPVVMMYDSFAATHSLKELPSFDETDSYLLGFIRGWMAADGSVTKSSQVSLCTSLPGKLWLTQISERLGFVIQRVYQQSSETNYGKRRQESHVIYFSRSSCIEDDFLCSWKRALFKPLESHFVVVETKPTGFASLVYCAEVPNTNTFTLAGGLITGNCSYIPIIDQRCFDEIMFILMNGTGVGYSVERQYVSKLPEVAETFHSTDSCITVADSKQGWAGAFRQLISLLYSGQIPTWDLSRIRPAGARLKTFGGRASGPKPLDELFSFTTQLFKKAAGRKLTSMEASDLVCKTAEVVVVGGVRRSALICLSNLTDERMRHYKNGQWWVDDKQRALANISAAYTETPDIGIFMKEWQALYESKSGERGIFNRVAAKKQSGLTGRRDPTPDFGTNPCGEIILRPFGFCNLSEVVIRNSDTFDDLKRKVRLATIIGTFQSTLTNFRYIRKQWQVNAEEERLLGVSLTGIMDHPQLSNSSRQTEKWLQELKNETINTNKEWADKLNIPQSAAITTIKPSGTVSQLVDSASGIHPRHNAYYIRTVRADAKDPLASFLQEQGVPNEPDVTNTSNVVFSFPIKSPTGCITRNERSAIDALEHYLVFKRNWCEHNPSITVYVKEHEWMEVGAWVYKNLDDIGGVSFLPHSEHIYQQAPYQDITQAQYEELSVHMPLISWKDFDGYEQEDSTTSSHEMACTGSTCELP